MKNYSKESIVNFVRGGLFIAFLVSVCGFYSCNTPYNPARYELLLKDEPRSEDYEVWVNGAKAFVYVARVQDAPFEKETVGLDFGGHYSFISFDMDKPVSVKIKSKNKVFDNMVLRPDGIHVSNVKKGASELSFIIDKPTHVIVEPDGKNSPLILFANPIDDFTPDLNDPNLIYYGPGIHHPDEALIKVGANQTLYLAEGAIVKAGVQVIDADHVTICGRGIICGNEFVWGGFSRSAIRIQNSNHVVVKDVILRGHATWTLPIFHSRNVMIDNVKIVAGRAQNDDGINPCNSQDIWIKNCFIRTDDDCIAAKGINFLPDTENNVERVTVENSILWCDRARIFLLGHESRAEYMKDMIFRNLDIVHFSMTAFLLEPGENMRLEHVAFENIRIYGEGQRELIRLRPVVNQYMQTLLPGYINNITFENMIVTGKDGPYKIQLMGVDEEYTVKNINFVGVSVNNQKITNSSGNLETGGFVYDVTFK